MTASARKHSVYLDQSLDPDHVEFMAYCLCGWTGPWVGPTATRGVSEAADEARAQMEDHLEWVTGSRRIGERSA